MGAVGEVISHKEDDDSRGKIYQPHGSCTGNKKAADTIDDTKVADDTNKVAMPFVPRLLKLEANT